MDTSRVCSRCKITKPKTTEFFPYRNKKKGWFSSWCVECTSEYKKSKKDWSNYLQRVRRGLAPCVVCGSKDKEKGRSYCQPCFLNKRREQKRLDKAIYKSRVRKATPPWADKESIKLFYKLRPIGYHVDHIIPLKGELVCGLNVLENLQYLSAKENMIKNNHYLDGNHYSLEHEGKK